MPASQVDILILGQGLSGSMLAFELISRGKRVMVIDNNHQGSASQVAAGIINPITGHRLNLTSGFADYFSCATKFYHRMENVLNASLIRSIDQIRLLKNPGQASYLEQRLNQQDYQAFLEENRTSTPFKRDEYGTAKVKQTAIVNTKVLLEKVRDWLSQNDSYHCELVDYSRIHFTSESIEYGTIKANDVIFCEGYQAIHNPWLKQLPFKLAKGEVLTLAKSTNDAAMLSWGNWLIPHNNNSVKLGSNYAWQDIQLAPSTGVREKLLDSLRKHTALTPDVLTHEVGIRPTTTHRHAFIGAISNLDHAYCFNGFGSKGCLTIPSHAELLSDHLLEKRLIPEELSKWL